MKTVAVPIGLIVQTTSNDGGYLSGECLLCGASGVTVAGPPSSRYGYPYGTKDVMGNRLFHKKSCPMNGLLSSTGEPK